MDNIIENEINKYKDYEGFDAYITFLKSCESIDEINELLLEDDLSNDEIKLRLNTFNEVLDKLQVIDIKDKLELLSKHEVVNIVQDMNNQLIKIAVEDDRYLDDILRLNNHVNSIYTILKTQDDEYFIDNILFLLRPLLSVIANITDEIFNYSDYISDENREFFLKGYIVFAKDQIQAYQNEFVYYSLEEKIDIVSKDTLDLPILNNVLNKMIDDNNKKDLVIFIENYLLSQILI